MKIEKSTELKLGKGFQTKKLTWSTLAFEIIGAKNESALRKIKAGLENEGFFNLGSGVTVTVVKG